MELHDAIPEGQGEAHPHGSHSSSGDFLCTRHGLMHFLIDCKNNFNRGVWAVQPRLYGY